MKSVKYNNSNRIKKSVALFAAVVVLTLAAVIAAYDYSDRYIPAYADGSDASSDASGEVQSDNNLIKGNNGLIVLWEWEQMTWKNYLPFLQEHEDKFFASMFVYDKGVAATPKGGIQVIEHPEFLAMYGSPNTIFRGSDRSMEIVTGRDTYRYDETHNEFELLPDFKQVMTEEFDGDNKKYIYHFDQYRTAYPQLDSDCFKEVEPEWMKRSRFVTSGGTMGTLLTRSVKTYDTDEADKTGLISSVMDVALSKPSFSTEMQNKVVKPDMSYMGIYNQAKYDTNNHYDPSFYYMMMPYSTSSDESNEPLIAFTHKGARYKGYVSDDKEAQAIAASKIRVHPMGFNNDSNVSIIAFAGKDGGLLMLYYLGLEDPDSLREILKTTGMSSNDIDKTVKEIKSDLGDSIAKGVKELALDKQFLLASVPQFYGGSRYNNYLTTRRGYMMSLAGNSDVKPWKNGYTWYAGTPHVFSAIKGENGVTTVNSGYLMPVGEVDTIDQDNNAVTVDGIILPEDYKIVVEKGGVLSIDGSLINNGKIINNGGTILIKDGGCISSSTDTKQGIIECNNGGQIIVMEKGKLCCSVNYKMFDEETNRDMYKLYASGEAYPHALKLTDGSSIINYGYTVISNMEYDSSAVIDVRKNGKLRLGYTKNDNDVLVGWMKDSELDKLYDKPMFDLMIKLAHGVRNAAIMKLGEDGGAGVVDIAGAPSKDSEYVAAGDWDMSAYVTWIENSYLGDGESEKFIIKREKNVTMDVADDYYPLKRHATYVVPEY